jgi:hypothetical protein
MFGSTQVLLKMANVSILSEDPCRSKCLVTCFNSGPSQLSDKTSCSAVCTAVYSFTGARVAPGWPRYCHPITEELGGTCSALIGPIDDGGVEGELPHVDHVPSYRQGP